MRVLPILFNTEMVRAILDDRKKATRRIVPLDIVNRCDIESDGKTLLAYENDCGDFIEPVKLCRYQPGDVIYVRETWCPFDDDHVIDGAKYAYKADASAESERIRKEYGYKWRPSIHMPKEAARIFLRVTDVRVERLQDITVDGCKAEGLNASPDIPGGSYVSPAAYNFEMQCLWDTTIKSADLPRYGWEANPWVWVIEFERCEKPEVAA